MTLDVRHVVSGRIVSGASAFLDQIQSNLPDESAVTLGNEFTVTRRASRDDQSKEVLRARMTFAPTGTAVELPDGSMVTPEKAAAQLFQSVANSDLAAQADNWELRHYLSPEGGVTASSVQAWYENHPDEQPTDEEGESVVPSRWEPDNHTISEVTQ